MPPCPRIMIAGTNSGVGKTSVTLALVSALTRRGLKAQTFKVGPDYLDPTYLTLASGRPCYNLDGWMAGREHVTRLFAEKAASADIAVIEGVMGLFDGSDPVGQEGSSSEIAAWLKAPVLLVANVHGMSRSIAAMVKGYCTLDEDIEISGVIANQCGSQRHREWLSETLAAFDLPPLVAAIPRGAFPDLPSRHLGLVTADSRNLSTNVLAMLADSMESNGDIDHILTIAAASPEFPTQAENGETPSQVSSVRLGIAMDEAFHFYYQDNLDALQANGCELIRFSPLLDERLPQGLDAVYIGGGYPEEHAEALAANITMIEDIRAFAASGKVVYGECGGLMYLSQGIECLDGRSIPLVGLLPSRTKMLDRLRALGYVEITLTSASLFGDAGDQLRGHEFHYSELVADPTSDHTWKTVYQGQRRRSTTVFAEGFQRDRVLASYVHVHFASKPESVKRFVRACAGSGKVDPDEL